jgi:hypothetical protein
MKRIRCNYNLTQSWCIKRRYTSIESPNNILYSPHISHSLILLLISINKIQIFHTMPRIHRKVIERERKNLKMIELTRNGFFLSTAAIYIKDSLQSFTLKGKKRSATWKNSEQSIVPRAAWWNFQGLRRSPLLRVNWI